MSKYNEDDLHLMDILMKSIKEIHWSNDYSRFSSIDKAELIILLARLEYHMFNSNELQEEISELIYKCKELEDELQSTRLND